MQKEECAAWMASRLHIFVCVVSFALKRMKACAFLSQCPLSMESNETELKCVRLLIYEQILFVHKRGSPPILFSRVDVTRSLAGLPRYVEMCIATEERYLRVPKLGCWERIAAPG